MTGSAFAMAQGSDAASLRERAMRLIALGIIGGMAVANAIWSLQTWPMGDIQIYWDAGQRVLAGEPLYPGEDPFHSYRYAPWFAWAWAALSVFPYPAVAAVWQASLLVATALVAIPFLRHGWVGIALAGLFVPLLFAVSAGGNVQALLVVSLLYGLHGRAGPLWVAVAASLRATPIFFAAVYAARREWARFWWSMGLTAALVAPMLWYDPASLVTGVAGQEPGLYSLSPALFIAVAVVSTAVVGWLAWRRSWATVIAAAAAAVVASPKLFGYDLTTFLAVNPDQPDT